MVFLKDIVSLETGSAQFRIKETLDSDAPLYKFYSQSDMLDSLNGIISENENKQIRTFDKVKTTSIGDIMFSLISGTTSIVVEQHSDYIYTQNYIKLTPKNKIDSKFLVYLLNESKGIKKQLHIETQGSQVLKHTTKQVKELFIGILPPLEKQKVIGDIYFKQLKLQSLKEKTAKNETSIILKLLEGEI